MTEKIELKEKLAAIDLGVKSLWDDIDDDQRKALKNEFFILNRYISSVKSSKREVQEHFVLTVNEYFNKSWYSLQKNHPKLLWQLLCLCSHESKQIFYHEWIGFKKDKKKSKNKILKVLQEIYQDKRSDELELLSQLYTESECKELAREYGWDDNQISKIFK
jgi:hypothetical protein